MCARCELARLSEPPPGPARWKLWQIPSGYHCSIIGTCLAPPDLDKILRRADRARQCGSEDYQLHGFFVGEAASGNDIGRLLHKTLDQKYPLDVARFGRERQADGLAALWRDAMATGKVAGAYWALMSHGRAPDALRAHAHGQIHILSHLMGGENRRSLRELAEARTQIQALETQLAENRRRAADLTGTRDRRLAEVEAQLAAALARPQAIEPAPAEGDRRAPRQHDRMQRRIAAERARARQAEAENQRLHAILDDIPARLAQQGPTAANPVMDTATAPALAALAGRSILYVGGRASVIPHLRAAATHIAARLLHHDGGIEQAARELDALVGAADIVFCPIDCVSHNACLRAKRLCRRLDKPFVPLHGSGATRFARALRALAAGS
jgi:hypothetical protein